MKKTTNGHTKIVLTRAISETALTLSVSLRWSNFTFLKLEPSENEERVPSLTNELPMNRLQKLPLVRTDTRCVDMFH